MHLRAGILLALALAGAATGCKTTAGAKTPTYLIRVERGDTLAGVAVKYDTTWEKIAKLNGLPDGSSLKVGAVLKVQPGPGGYLATTKDGFLTSSTSDRRVPKGVATKLPKRVKEANSTHGNNVNAADLDDGSEDDFPVVPRAGGHGLLFGGGAGAARDGLEWPLYGELSSHYGMRNGRFHNGIDLRAQSGTAILAAGPGVVEFAGRQHGYGRVIIIRHHTLKTVYAHLSSIDVSVGQKVTHTTSIGQTGTSGNSTGPHLHFEIRTLKDESMDPLSVLRQDKLLISSNR